MAFIEKKDPVVLNIKLTTKGRELLSTGTLGFNYFAIGDSEIDYKFNNETGLIPFDSRILRPADANPSLLSFIPRNLSGDPYNTIPSLPSTWYPVTNTVGSIGFFTNSGNTFITDSNHVKQPDAMVDTSVIYGGLTLQLLKAPTYGTSGNEPIVGDLLLIKWSLYTDTTGYTISANNPTPYLIYQIVTKTGSLANNNLIVTVDRNLPNFSGYSATAMAGAMIYYNYINFSGDTIYNDYSTDYLDESVLAFLQNSQCPTVVFPFWNISIIYTDEIAGVQLGNKTFSQFDTVGYGGFVSYIQNQAPIYSKLGVIHYTNSSPANVYAEGFYLTTPKLIIPTIMWHKSSTKTLGVTLTAYGSVKLLTGSTVSLNTEYYDLADIDGNIVGKVFTDLKIFVIEDQELLFAMSYKSNRSWTLSDYISSVGGGGCVQPPAPPLIIDVLTRLGSAGFGAIDTGGYEISGSTSLTEYGMYYRTGTGIWSVQSISGALLNNYFDMTLNGLNELTSYEYKAYVKSGILGATGATYTTTTKSIPSVQTTVATSSTTYVINGVGGNSIPGDVWSGVTSYAVQYRIVGSGTWLYAPLPVNVGNPGGTSFGPINIGTLSSNTNYEYRAWIQIGADDYYGAINYISTSTVAAIAPTVITTAISAYNQTTATGGGNVTSDGGATVTTRGVVWNTSSSPTIALTTKTINGTGTGGYVSSLTGLAPNTLYYVRAYATNSVGTSYGGEASFTTLMVTAAPIVTTTTPYNYTSTSASGGGTISSVGSASVTAHGVVWSTSPMPTIPSSNSTNSGAGIVGSFSSAIGSPPLIPNTTYYVRAYATNSVGTGYGSTESFTTTSTPTITLDSISNITNIAAQADATIASDGGASLTCSGIVWNTSSNPTTILPTKTTNGPISIGSFVGAISSLSQATQYYVRAYACNTNGIAYSTENCFTTTSLPAICLSSVTGITGVLACANACISSFGGATAVQSGVAWSTSPNPTTASPTKTTGGPTSVGPFSHPVSTLNLGTQYYLRAYACNTNGVTYSNECAFTTTCRPTLSLNTISNITNCTADINASLTSTGNATMLCTGLVWGLNTNPDISCCKTTGGPLTPGPFNTTISALLESTCYYVRAYGCNINGISYSNESSFSTISLPTVEYITFVPSPPAYLTASFGGCVITSGSSAVNERGVVWGDNPNPTITCCCAKEGGTGLGNYNVTMTGLTCGCSYQVRAYACNTSGVGYGTNVIYANY